MSTKSASPGAPPLEERRTLQNRRFEDLLLELSAELVDLPSAKIDEKLASALARISSYLDVDRSSILKWSEGHDGMVLSHSWQAPGIAPTPPQVRRASFPYLMNTRREGRSVVFSDPGELPPEAELEREQFEKLGVRSLAALPLKVGGLVVGAMSFSSLTRSIRWSEPLLQRLGLLSDLIASTIERGRHETQLERRHRFEELLLSLSANLIQLPPAEIDNAIEDGLRLVADYLDVERVALLEFSEDGKRLTGAHCHAAEGIRSLRGEQVDVLFPRYAEDLATGKIASVERSDRHEGEGLAAADRALEEGVKSNLGLPLRTGDAILGVLDVASFDHRRKWPEDLVRRLQLIGEIFSNALSRKRSELTLAAAYDEIRELNDKLEVENVLLREEIGPRRPYESIIGESPNLRTALVQMERVASTDTTVLVLGETGTGKELVAEAIHERSPRRQRTMVRVNCAALPPSLIESELFGREKGAFTDAHTREAGRFEAADGSTLFLDEVAELPLELQPKLLRVLEEGRFERLGSTRTLEVDVRVIAATNRDLQEEVAQGRFREDLFYRLNVFPIQVPPLRDRTADIPLLVWAFVRELCQRLGRSIDAIPRKSLEALQHYQWPGNVRELRNLVERALILNEGSTLEIRPPATTAPLATPLQLDDVQRSHIVDVLERTHWRVRGEAGAAELLGLKPTTLEYKMKRLGIQRPASGT